MSWAIPAPIRFSFTLEVAPVGPRLNRSDDWTITVALSMFHEEPEMKISRCALPLVLLAFSSASQAQEGATEPSRGSGLRAEALGFLRDHVIGRAVEVTTSYKAGDKIENLFTRRMTYTNLVETKKGLKFDAISIIKQTIYDLDDKGERVGEGKTKNRALLLRFEVAELESAPKLRGFYRIISNTAGDPTGSGAVVFITMRDDRLVIDQTTIGFDDFFAAEGGMKPGVSETRAILHVQDGRLHVEETERNYYVDPDGQQRAPVSDPVELKGVEVDS